MRTRVVTIGGSSRPGQDGRVSLTPLSMSMPVPLASPEEATHRTPAANSTPAEARRHRVSSTHIRRTVARGPCQRVAHNAITDGVRSPSVRCDYRVRDMGCRAARAENRWPDYRLRFMR